VSRDVPVDALDPAFEVQDVHLSRDLSHEILLQAVVTSMVTGTRLDDVEHRRASAHLFNGLVQLLVWFVSFDGGLHGAF
jgi:hypothetical protein